ncbi:MAG TPA: hypothetical protein VIM71_05240 [Lacunisphaera sp.]
MTGRFVPMEGVMLRLRLGAIMLFIGLSSSLFGAADWSRVKAGITAAQTAEALGKPLIRTYGRGFEVWIYDSCGEVVFGGGPALGWSMPVPNPESASRPVERDVLIKPVVRLPTLRSLTPQQTGPSELSETRFRYGRQR